MAELVLTGLWKEADEAFPELRRQIPDALNKAVLQEAQDLRKRMVKQFQAGAPIGGQWASLAPLTLNARKARGFGGSKILIATGDLRNSIAVQAVSSGVVFVGVSRSAKGNAKGFGGILVNLGELHEFGKTIRIVVTRKMQRFLFGVLLKTKKGRDIRGKFVKKGAGRSSGGSGKFKLGATLIIRIPARPFVGPAVDAMSPAEYEASIAERLSKILKIPGA